MNALLPIIRRARRPLYPPDGAGAPPQPAPVVPPAVVEPPPLVPQVETSVESAPVETTHIASVEQAPVEPPAPVAAKPKKTKRSANPPE